MRRLALGHEPCAISNALRTNDPFRRYKQEPSHEVRQAEVKGTELDKLRARREMLRDMAPEQALSAVRFYRNLSFFEALELAQREDKMIVPNAVHDRILTETKDVKLLEQLYYTWAWTGTLVIYEKPDMEFGKEITFSWVCDQVEYSISFTVPKQFRGKKNCALVIEHPDFEILEISKKPSIWSRIFSRNKSNTENQYELRLAEGANIHLIENFPRENLRWYALDPETKIPHGEPIKESQRDLSKGQTDRVHRALEARFFGRFDCAYIGLVARVVAGDIERRYILAAKDLWTQPLNVALF